MTSEHYLADRMIHTRLLQLTNGDVCSVTGVIDVIYLTPTTVSTCEGGSMHDQ